MYDLKISVLSLSLIYLYSCATVKSDKTGVDIESRLKDGARVMWIAAHPDDESMVGALLLRSSLYYKNPLYFLVLTHGDGGECCIKGGCHPDLKTVRGEELKKVAKAYNAELQHEYLFNAPLPMESFPPRHIIARKWREEKDPIYIVAEAIRRFKPDIVITFDPYRGFTGHPEHQLASRFAIAGIIAAADSEYKIEHSQPHRVRHLYFGLNKYFIFKILGQTDPSPVTEEWNMNKECAGGKSCKELLSKYTRFHRSQENDMGTVRKLLRWIDTMYLSEYDPFKHPLDPYEEVK
ncbi:MAG: PIG-L family deacetylase [Myxococcota bacterium]